MKKIYFMLILCLIVLKTQAQTTLQYSGTGTNTYLGSISKVGGIGQNHITANTVGSHIGLVGTATNASNNNIGILGTTVLNTVNNSNYIAVLGDNYNNFITANNRTVTGGKFLAGNQGTNAYTFGVDSYAFSNNNGNTTLGINSIVVNNSNTNPNTTIAIKGVTTSGQSTVTNILKDVANPGGYFSSSDGQGIYATTSGTYKYGSTTVSQAITGYSNATNAFDNIGVVGYAEGTGSVKAGMYGLVDGAAGSIISSGIVGQDNIGVANSYAGYFEGKVYANGKMGVGIGTVSNNEQMEVNGRVRIRSNIFAAGLWFNNSANNTALTDGAFVGLRNETPGSETVGFFLNNAFRFYVDRLGNATVGGGLSVGGGQTINKIIKTSISTNINPYGATSFLTQNFTVTGVAVGDNIVVNIDALPANFIIASSRVSANDTIEVKFYNFGAANGFPAPVTMNVTAFK